ncbi:MAG TPA: hypothetical protein VM431_02560, partial [Phycisphaerae bacterium]|nr:hypothetical protein [Phycisphaerae bacterium]
MTPDEDGRVLRSVLAKWVFVQTGKECAKLVDHPSAPTAGGCNVRSQRQGLLARCLSISQCCLHLRESELKLRIRQVAERCLN